MPSSVAGAIGGSVVSGLIGGAASKKAAKTQANAAEDAAEAQLTAAREANALQERMYTQNRADVGPWRDAGVNAMRKLQYGMGLPYQQTTFPTNTFAAPSGASGAALSAPNRADFTRPPQNYEAPITYVDQWIQEHAGLPIPGETFDQAGYDAALKAYQQQQAAQTAQTAQGAASQAGGTWNPAAGDPAAGYLSRDFQMSDYQQDPGYGFRLSEGMKALERSAAARGGLLSGGALKGISRYSQDYASNEFTNAFNRYMQQRGNQYNQLASMAGIGQTATANLGAAGQNYANNAGANIMGGAANASNALTSGAAARASGYVGGANAMIGGINNAVGSYQQNQLLNRLLPQQNQNYNAGGTFTPYYSGYGAGGDYQYG